MTIEYNNSGIPVTNQIKNEYVCIDLFSEDWYIKITDGNGHYEYLNIRENHNSNFKFTNISQIFKKGFLRLPESYHNKITGKTVTWSIADYKNIYYIRNLQEEYWDKPDDPECFEVNDDEEYIQELESFKESENESYDDNIFSSRRMKEKTFFDRLVENL